MKLIKCIYSRNGDINYKYFSFKDSDDVEDIAWTCKRWTERHQLTLIDITNGKEKVLPKQLASIQGDARRILPTSDIWTVRRLEDRWLSNTWFSGLHHENPKSQDWKDQGSLLQQDSMGTEASQAMHGKQRNIHPRLYGRNLSPITWYSTRIWQT